MDNALSRDLLFGGTVSMSQSKTGYRYSIDPILLAHFINIPPQNTAVDLGTGSGILPVILTHRHPKLKVWAIEIQQSLITLARKNIRDNSLEHRVTLIEGDLTRPSELGLPRGMALVVSNPPYTPRNAGRLNPSSEKALARHEITCTLSRLIQSAHDILEDEGRFAVIYPESRCEELLCRLENHGFSPSRLRPVHPLSGGPVKRVLVDAVKGGRADLTVLPPLVIFKGPGIYSEEVKAMFE